MASDGVLCGKKRFRKSIKLLYIVSCRLLPIQIKPESEPGKISGIKIAPLKPSRDLQVPIQRQRCKLQLQCFESMWDTVRRCTLA